MISVSSDAASDVFIKLLYGCQDVAGTTRCSRRDAPACHFARRACHASNATISDERVRDHPKLAELHSVHHPSGLRDVRLAPYLFSRCPQPQLLMSYDAPAAVVHWSYRLRWIR